MSLRRENESRDEDEMGWSKRAKVADDDDVDDENDVYKRAWIQRNKYKKSITNTHPFIHGRKMGATGNKSFCYY